MDPINFRQVRELIPLRDYLEYIGWRQVRRLRRSLRGRCPLCQPGPGRSTPFDVAPPFWFCHRCQRGGDVIALVALTWNLDTVRAAATLCGTFGVEIPRIAAGPTQQMRKGGDI